MPEFSVYVTGGGEYFYTTLNAVAMIFNDGKLVYAVIALGAFFALITGAWYYIQKNIGSGLLKSHTWLEHGLVMVLLTFVAFVPTRVTVQEIYGQQIATPVDNVPLMISVPAAMFSGIGYDTFTTIDTAFQSTSGSTMSVSENGFVTPLKLMLSLRGGLQQVSPELYSTWYNYIGGCLHNSAATTGGINQAVDVAEYMTSTGKDAGFITVYLRQSGGAIEAFQNGVTVTCAEAKTLLNLRMDALFASGGATNPMSDVDRVINMGMDEPNRNQPNGKWTWADATSAVTGFQAMAHGAGQTAQQFMKNSLMRSVVSDAYQCASTQLSPADQFMCTQLMNDAMEQYKIDSAGQASWFSQMMLPAMTILQLLFFAFSVVAFLYGMLRGAGALSFIGKYFLFGAWVFSWLPFVAIINAFINWMVVDKMALNSVQALTLENYDAYFSGLQSSLALASNLLAATPLITLGFMTGSMYAMSGFAQRLSSNDYMKESNAAPSTVDVAPVMRFNSEFDANAVTGYKTAGTTYDNIDVKQLATKGAESARVEAQIAQRQTLDQFSQMVRAQQQNGGSTRIAGSDTASVQAHEQAMYKNALSSVNGHEIAKSLSATDMASVDRYVKAGLEGFGTGTGISGTWKDAINSAENDNVKKAVNLAFEGMTSYAEDAGRQLSSQILSDTSSSNSKAREIASGFSEVASKSNSLTDSYKEATMLSQQLGVGVSMGIDQFGAALAADEANPTGGLGLGRQINDAKAQVISDIGEEAFQYQYNQKMADWKGSHSNANFQNMEQAAESIVIAQHRPDLAANIYAQAKGYTPPDLGDHARYAGVSNGVENISINQDISAHENRVPDWGYGHANLQSVQTLQKQLLDSGVDDSARQTALKGLKASVERVAKGTLDPNMDINEAHRNQYNMKLARDNLASQPETNSDYRKAMYLHNIKETHNGFHSPPPIPPEETIELMRQSSVAQVEKDASKLDQPLSDKELQNRKQEAIRKVDEHVEGIVSLNKAWADIGTSGGHTPPPLHASEGGSSGQKQPVDRILGHNDKN